MVKEADLGGLDCADDSATGQLNVGQVGHGLDALSLRRRRIDLGKGVWRKLRRIGFDSLGGHSEEPIEVKSQIYVCCDCGLQHRAHNVEGEAAFQSTAKQGVIFDQALHAEHSFREIVRRTDARVLMAAFDLGLKVMRLTKNR